MPILLFVPDHMLYSWRASSISNVHFKRSLLFPPILPLNVSKTNPNSLKLTEPSRQSCTSTSLPLGRLWALVPVFYSTHYNDADLAHSFCSKFLKASAKMALLPEGKQLHGYAIKLGLYGTLSLQNQILDFYVKCKEFNSVRNLFAEMSVRNVVSFNTVICGFVRFEGDHCSILHLSFHYFRVMKMDMVAPDDVTCNGLLRSCVEFNDIKSGRQLHCFTVKSGFDSNFFVGSAIIDLYAKNGLAEDARLCFNQISFRDLVLWNVMLHCYVFNSLAEQAFMFFHLMRVEGMKGDGFTFSTLLSSCSSNIASFQLVPQLHGLLVKRSFDYDILVASALVNMYVKNENMDDARKAFEGMVFKNVVCWTTMIVGYGHHGEGKEAVRLFQRMLKENFYPDELTLASVLSSCAKSSAISELTQVHSYTVKSGIQSFVSIINALINAYAKCGFIVTASQCFSLVMKPNLVTWTSIINAYAFHGLAEEAIEYFEKMLSCDIRPDRVAMLGVLSSCSHKGLVIKGIHYFNLMIHKYQIQPDMEHYTCLIDLIGRAGLVDEASSFLSLLPIEAWGDAVGALIGACKIHGDVRLAKWATEMMFALEPNNAVNYTLMSNMYASEGRWVDVARTRKMMRDKCGYKSIGYSWIEIAGETHKFVSSDKSHPQALKVYEMSGLLLWLMRDSQVDTRLDAVWMNGCTLASV